MSFINVAYCSHAAQALASKKDKTTDEIEKLQVLNDETRRLGKDRLVISNTFYDDLKARLKAIEAHTEDGNSGGHVSREVIKAKFQADYIIAHWYRNRKCHVVMSTDKDFSILARSKCTCIKAVNISTEKINVGKKRKRCVEKVSSYNFELGGGSNNHMNSLQNTITMKYSKSKIAWTKATYPILDVGNDRLASLFAIGIGCDVFVGGINGVTAKFILTKEMTSMQEKHKEVTYNCVMESFLKKDKTGLTKEVLDTFVNAFMYEPAIQIRHG